MPLTSDDRDAFFEKIEQVREVIESLDAKTKKFDPSKKNASIRYRSAIEIAQKIYSHRKARLNHFADARLFGEPAWDILLDLYIRRSQGEIVSVKSASIGSRSPETTALRWLKVLEDDGLIKSVSDPSDRRRRLVKLTAEGYETMTHFLEEVGRQDRRG